MKLLIADDEMQIRTGLEVGISWEDYGINTVFTAENGMNAWEIIQREKPEIILTDIRMPGLNGLEIGKMVSELYQPSVVILLSGYSEFEYAREAVKIGAYDYLLKPISIEDLLSCMEKAIAHVKNSNRSIENREIAEGVRRKKKLEQILEKNEGLKEEERSALAEYIGIDKNAEILAGLCVADTAESGKKESFGAYFEQIFREEMASLGAHFLYRKEDQVMQDKDLPVGITGEQSRKFYPGGRCRSFGTCDACGL